MTLNKLFFPLGNSSWRPRSDESSWLCHHFHKGKSPYFTPWFAPINSWQPETVCVCLFSFSQTHLFWMLFNIWDVFILTLPFSPFKYPKTERRGRHLCEQRQLWGDVRHWGRGIHPRKREDSGSPRNRWNLKLAIYSWKQECRPVRKYHEAKINPYKTNMKDEPKFTSQKSSKIVQNYPKTKVSWLNPWNSLNCSSALPAN